MDTFDNDGRVVSAPPVVARSSPTFCELFTTFLAAALYWLAFGYAVIPIVPGTKKTAVRWDPWLDGLSVEKIIAHWTENPDHELGFIPGDDIFVLDADSPESLAATVLLEQTFDRTPQLLVKTFKGEHHHFRRSKGTFAKSDAHSTKAFPARIDVKTGRTMVVLPPSTGKEIQIADAENASELTEATQEFIDAVDRHNGRQPYRPTAIPASPSYPSESSSQNVAEIKAMLPHTKRILGYADWLNGLMGIFHETGGSAEGFEIADTWSQTLANYKGPNDVMVKWKSFRLDVENPRTIATIRQMVTDNGGDWLAICASAESGFEVIDTENIAPDNAVTVIEPPLVIETESNHPLTAFSLRDHVAELEKIAVDQVPFLGELSLQGELGCLFGKPNGGKTLIVMSLAIDSVVRGLINPAMLFYINVDDTSQGLLTKLRLAKQHGFHMLADGHRGFKSSDFLAILNDLLEKNQCRGVMFILDTLTKFVNSLDATRVRYFTSVARRFSQQGGTMLALSHLNKYPGADGKPVYRGTSDMLNDFDCAYVMTRTDDADSGIALVEFENQKMRGNVVPKAAYSFNADYNLSYTDRLASVKPVGDTQLAAISQAAQFRSDAEVVAAITTCIQEGITSKMLLRDAAALRLGVSKTSVLNVIHRHTGDDTSKHKWNFTVGARGANIYALLDAPPAPSPDNTQG